MKWRCAIRALFSGRKIAKNHCSHAEVDIGLRKVHMGNSIWTIGWSDGTITYIGGRRTNICIGSLETNARSFDIVRSRQERDAPAPKP